MKKMISLTIAVILVLGMATAVLAVGEEVTWKGIEWKAVYGSITVNAGGDLEVTTTSCYTTSCWGAAHYNTPGDFRAAATPWVRVTFLDTGLGAPGVQLWMEDEGGNEPAPDPSRSWTQFGAWERDGYDNYRIYWWNVHTDEDGLVDTGVARTAGEHVLMLGKRSDGTIDYWLDGALVFSTTSIAPDYFGDIYLAGHSDSNNPDQTVIFTDYEVGTDYSILPVGIDIKPGSDPNSINLGSKGVVPVAVLTTDDFDASIVDPVNVLFAGASPVRWMTEDVDGDGDMDLLLHFKTQELDLDESSNEATLTGVTFGGQLIQGTDTVNIVKGN